MSQSPVTATVDENDQGYFQAWNELGGLASAGKSFSGREKNCVFWNIGMASARSFADVSGPSGLDFPDDGRALAAVDWDHDGDLDLWMSNRTAPRVRFMRNNLPATNHYLAIRLEGQTCNRDAIGARVEVAVKKKGQEARGEGQEASRGDDGHSENSLVEHSTPSIQPLTLIKTLRAGEGFLAQSSKWLHFGLGDSQQVEQVVVRWPSGDVETLTGLKVDQRYVIVQQTGEAKRWKDPRPPPTLKPSSPSRIPPTDKARIVMVEPVTMPKTPVMAIDGKSISIMAAWNQTASKAASKGLVVNLWATWCKPCVVELREFDRRAAELRDAGLEVMAISVDGIDASHGLFATNANSEPGRTAADRLDVGRVQGFLKQLDFSFVARIASLELVRDLDLLQQSIVSEKRAMPVPTSFLVNRQGKVVVIYKGEVSVEQLLADMSVLDGNIESRFREAAPYAGRWAVGMIDTTPIGSARTYLEAGYIDHAIRHLVDALRLRPNDIGILTTIANLYVTQGKSDAAIERYRETLAIDPKQVDARFRLALTLHNRGDFSGGVEQLRKILDLQPTSISAANSLAWILATNVDDRIRNGEEAVMLAERMNQATEYREPKLLDTLAAAYAEVGRYSDAIRVARAALELIGEEGEKTFVDRLRNRLALYEESRPIREEVTNQDTNDQPKKEEHRK